MTTTKQQLIDTAQASGWGFYRNPVNGAFHFKRSSRVYVDVYFDGDEIFEVFTHRGPLHPTVERTVKFLELIK